VIDLVWVWVITSIDANGSSFVSGVAGCVEGCVWCRYLSTMVMDPGPVQPSQVRPSALTLTSPARPARPTDRQCTARPTLRVPLAHPFNPVLLALTPLPAPSHIAPPAVSALASSAQRLSRRRPCLL
jgi:hypothetical protein